MRIGVPRERAEHERRVAHVPDIVALLVKTRHEVAVEGCANASAGFPDAQYAGCAPASSRTLANYRGFGPAADKGTASSPEKVMRIHEGCILAAVLAPASSQDVIAALAHQEDHRAGDATRPARQPDAVDERAQLPGQPGLLQGGDRLDRD